MAPKNCKKSNTKKAKQTSHSNTSSSSPFSLQVVNTPLPQVLPGGPYQTNPDLIDGPRNAFEAKTVKEGFYVRVDMPGVGKDTVEVNFENKKLFFNGKAPKESAYEAGPRNYHGEIKFSSESVEVSEVKVDMNNGVLRMVLVGSGFPPDSYASSTHFNRQSPDVFESLVSLTNGMMVPAKMFTLFDQPVNYVGMYPFQLDGTKGAYEIQGLGEFCFLRYDMPDVDAVGLILRLKDRTLTHAGKGVNASEYDESIRIYLGKFEMRCPCACKLVDVHSSITNGVLRMLIKKEADQATERMGNTGCSEAGPR